MSQERALKLFCSRKCKRAFNDAGGPPQETVVHSTPNVVTLRDGTKRVKRIRAETPWRTYHIERGLCLQCRKSLKAGPRTLNIPPRDEVLQTGTNVVPLKRRTGSE